MSGMRLKKAFKKVLLGCLLAFGVFKGAEACAPGPNLTQVYNNAAAVRQQAAEYRLPSLAEPSAEQKKDLWRVRVGAWEMGAGGHHTFLEFSPYDGNDAARLKVNEVYQIHGIATDEVRRTWAYLDLKNPDSYKRYGHGDFVLKGLGINFDHERKYFRQPPVAYVDIYYGSKEEVLKMYLDGMKIIEGVNRSNDPYILLSHNSNSVQHTIVQALGLQEPPLYVAHRWQAVGGRIWTPGLEKSLLPANWNRQQVREEGGYAGLSAPELEQRAKAVQGADRMFATFRAPKPPLH